MNPILLSLLGIVALIVVLFSGVQIGIALAGVGFIGFGLLRGWAPAIGLLKTIPYTSTAVFSLAVMPLFILMGQLAFYSGISSQLYDACNKWLGRFKGGIAVATVGACAMFAAICGSSTATSATIGTVALPEMSKYKYDKSLSAGLIAAGGTLGILIPPSVTFIVIGTITMTSIGDLFAAGIVPGILIAVVFMAIILIRAARNPELAPAGEKFPLGEMVRSLKGVWGFLVLFIIVLGGIFGGFISPSEGGGLGAFGSFVILLLSRKASFKTIVKALRDTIKTTAMIFIIMIGAAIFGQFLSSTGLPGALAGLATSMNVPSIFILICILVVFIVLGCFVDALPLTIILVPIFWPLVREFGWSPTWFGVIITICYMVGLLTPPVGLNCYVMVGVAKDVTLPQIFRGATPFTLGALAVLILIVAFPQIATFLPQLLYGR